jgi:hypothetical protein
VRFYISPKADRQVGLSIIAGSAEIAWAKFAQRAVCEPDREDYEVVPCHWPCIDGAILLGSLTRARRMQGLDDIRGVDVWYKRVLGNESVVLQWGAKKAQFIAIALDQLTSRSSCKTRNDLFDEAFILAHSVIYAESTT